jgi:hypothetical protein
MKRIFLVSIVFVLLALNPVFSADQERPRVGGFEQIPAGHGQEADIGAGWGHRSMTYGVMNLMSGMSSQAASILRSGKATPEMMGKLAHIMDHIADMLNYAPAYMMGTKTVDSDMMNEMQGMLKELEKMRNEIHGK